METISCIIVDDEPNALALLEKYVSNTPFLDLRKKCANGIEVIDFFNNNTVDVIFMDIQMPELTGIQLSRILPKTTKIIFTTAFDQYAIEGFKLDALDYLLKPFDYSEFLHAACKARDWFQLVRRSQQKNVLPVQQPEPEKKYLFVKSDYKQIKILFENILYIEGLKDYAKIWLKDQPKAILTLMSLKRLEEELPGNLFMRIHRSFIIALDKIDSIERSQVIINKQRITVSEQYKNDFNLFLNRNSLD